jgi:hypothetical protein
MLALQMPAAEPHHGFFAPLFQFVSQQADKEKGNESLAGFLASSRVRERADDDLTLVLATLIEADV